MCLSGVNPATLPAWSRSVHGPRGELWQGAGPGGLFEVPSKPYNSVIQLWHRARAVHSSPCIPPRGHRLGNHVEERFKCLCIRGKAEILPLLRGL